MLKVKKHIPFLQQIGHLYIHSKYQFIEQKQH